MTKATIPIIHDNTVITSFVRDHDVRWREVRVMSDKWTETDAKVRISEGRSARHGVPPGMLDKQEHARGYYGVAYLDRGAGRPLELLRGPQMWSFPDGDGRAVPSMPREDGAIRIKYEFPDGGMPIWHRNVAAALDAIMLAPTEEWVNGVTLRMLRRVVENATRRGDAR